MHNINFNSISDLITDIENEIKICKSLLESVKSENNSEYVPMIVFYSNSDTKQLVVAPKSTQDFDEKMLAIAEAMHLFTPLESYAAILSLTTKMKHDDELYEALTLHVLSQDHAYNIILPYQFINNTVVWNDDLAYSSMIDEEDIDDTGKDIVSMLYLFVHIEKSIFSPSEILSYLSSKGAAIHQISTKIEYFNVG